MLPQDGIEFDLPPEQHRQMPKALLSSVRRLHINTGHPPNAELERIVRLAGGSDLAQSACRGLRCTVCRKSLPAKSPKPGKPKYNIGQFNDTVLVDLGYVKDVDCAMHGYMVIVDDGTDWRVCQSCMV